MNKPRLASLKEFFLRGASRVPRGKKPLIILLLSALAVLALFQAGKGLYRRFGPAAAQEQNAGDLSRTGESIGYYRVDPRDVVESIDILGQIVFFEKVNVSSKVNGRLDKIYIKEGTRVHKNQLIAEIERLSLQLSLKEQQAELDIAMKSFDLANARYENSFKAIEIKFAQIRKARAEVYDKKIAFDNMTRTLNNKAVLFKAGGISESDYEAVKAQHTSFHTRYVNANSDLEIQEVGFRDIDITSSGYTLPKTQGEKVKLYQAINTKMEKAELEAARSKIRQVEQSIQSTRILITETYIRSPLTGVVAVKNMEAGEIVKNDSVIATLMDISKVFLSLNISEKDSKAIKDGQEVSFTADAFSGETFNGRVARITPVFDVKTRTFEIKALVPNPGMRLIPGMFARAKIITGKKSGALLVPLSSLISKEAAAGEVYLVKKGIVFKQKIELGKEHEGAIEAVKGLEGGDIIVSKGINLVYPDMKVEQ